MRGRKPKFKIHLDAQGRSELEELQRKTVAPVEVMRARVILLLDEGQSLKATPTMLRYNTNGSLDTTFDGDGKLSVDLFYNDGNIVGLAQQSSGKIVAAGGYGGLVFIFDVQDHNFQLTRYNTNGQLDTTFGTAGRVSTDFVNGSIDIPSAIAVLPDDRIVVAGSTRPELSGLNDLILARYTPDGALYNPDFMLMAKAFGIRPMCLRRFATL